MAKIEPRYGALSIDTSIFKREGLVFETGLLKQLEQFAGGPVKIIFPDIVHRELRKHLIAQTNTVQDAVTKALKNAGTHLRASNEHIDDASSLLNAKENPVAIVDRRLAAFYAATGAEVLNSATHVDVARLIELYFDCGAPFELVGPKKSEFPDAIALLALEDWAKKSQVDVLVVSADKGWQEFGKHSDRLEVIDSLGEAISRFQPFHAIDRIIEGLQQALLNGGQATLAEQLDNAVTTHFARTEIQTTAASSYHFQCLEVLTALLGHAIECDSQGAPAVVPIRIEDDRVVLQLGLKVRCEVHAKFLLSLWNRLNHRYERFAEVVPAVEKQYHREVLMTLTGDFSKDFEDLTISDIQILGEALVVDFGTLEVDLLQHL